jgi:cell wall-associated NlpC family hydrolase
MKSIKILMLFGLLILLQASSSSASFAYKRLLQNFNTPAFAEICLKPPTIGQGADPTTYEGSLTYDLPERLKFLDAWLKTKTEPWKWSPPVFPKVLVPSFVTDTVAWKRDRVLTVARSLIGFPYQHNRIPYMINPENGCGLDCSNFSGWAYNFGLGIYFRRDIDGQAQGGPDPRVGAAPGRVLGKDEKLQPADLVFFYDSVNNRYKHVAIVIDEKNIIHAPTAGSFIRIDKFVRKYDMARRIIE